jgi:cyclopropane-fatty-acyl-phospholipid synthase
MWEKTMLERVLVSSLEGIVKVGDLTVRLPSGRAVRLGDRTGPHVSVQVEGRDSCIRLLRDPALALGELYMEGKLTIVEGTLIDLVEIGLKTAYQGPRRLKKQRRFANPKAASARNVAHHYNLDEAFYRRFLDKEMQYSCAYWGPGVTDLEAAQKEKLRHIAAKLCIEPGQRVLDVGCGWGGMALHLAREHGAEVLGVTLSEPQLEAARARAEAEGLSGRVRFALMDYRDIGERFDRVVSVGMLEHVGPADLPVYFAKLREVMKDDGVALVHSIGRAGPPAETNGFIKKHVFPGGHLPALSQLAPAVEASGLWLCDLEVLRLHYAKTLKAWRERFERQADAVAAEKGAEFVRLWRFYLCASEAAFTAADQLVFQLQLGAERDCVPLTRDYLYQGGMRVPRAANAA